MKSSCVRHVLAVLLLASASTCRAQAVFDFIFSPANPVAGQEVTVAIRGTDPTAGFVYCPQAEKIITAARIAGSNITLDVYPIGVPGGVMRTQCIGNAFLLGPLQAGTYSVVARSVFGNAVGPIGASGQLSVVGGVGIPTVSPPMLAVVIACLALVGMRRLKRAS